MIRILKNTSFPCNTSGVRKEIHIVAFCKFATSQAKELMLILPKATVSRPILLDLFRPILPRARLSW